VVKVKEKYLKTEYRPTSKLLDVDAMIYFK